MRGSPMTTECPPDSGRDGACVTARCKHDWQPLVTATPDTDNAVRLSILIQRLHEYERCIRCGRLSYRAKSHAAPRRLCGEWLTRRISDRLREHEEWARDRACGGAEKQRFD